MTVVREITAEDVKREQEKSREMLENIDIKHTLMELARAHKWACTNPSCGVSLYHVQRAVERLGIELSDSDRRILT